MQALRRTRKHGEDLLLITDVCCCEYTSHGHCGVLRAAESAPAFGDRRAYQMDPPDATITCHAADVAGWLQSPAS